MIQSFKCKLTKQLWNREYSKKLALSKILAEKAYDKLRLVHFANEVNDLNIPPGNKLEALKGNRKGQFSIRINNQWRICFNFENGNAYEVEIADYH